MMPCHITIEAGSDRVVGSETSVSGHATRSQAS